MPYRVYGLDGATRQPRKPLLLEVETEQAARSQAEALGMVVDSAEYVGPNAAPPDAASTGPEPATASPKWYEFTPEQDIVIGDLARYMRMCAGVLVAFAILRLVFWFFSNRMEVAPAFGEAVLGMVIGALTYGAATNFQRIVDTRGRDINHLMDALSGLKLIYLVQVWLIALALAVAGFVALLALLR